MTDNRCYLRFRMLNGDSFRTPIFDGPGYATDWLENPKHEYIKDEDFIIIRHKGGTYDLLNVRHIVSVELVFGTGDD